MPTFQTDVAGKLGKLGKAGNIDQSLYQGAVKFLTATVTVPNALAANDLIEIGNLPTGCRVLPHMCNAVCHADPGTTLTLDIGDSADVDRYADGIVLSSGGVVNFTSAAIPDGTKNPVKATADTLIYATVMSADTITNNSKITFTIAFVN